MNSTTATTVAFGVGAACVGATITAAISSVSASKKIGLAALAALGAALAFLGEHKLGEHKLVAGACFSIGAAIALIWGRCKKQETAVVANVVRAQAPATRDVEFFKDHASKIYQGNFDSIPIDLELWVKGVKASKPIAEEWACKNIGNQELLQKKGILRGDTGASVLSLNAHIKGFFNSCENFKNLIMDKGVIKQEYILFANVAKQHWKDTRDCDPELFYLKDVISAFISDITLFESNRFKELNNINYLKENQDDFSFDWSILLDQQDLDHIEKVNKFFNKDDSVDLTDEDKKLIKIIEDKVGEGFKFPQNSCTSLVKSAKKLEMVLRGFSIPGLLFRGNYKDCNYKIEETTFFDFSHSTLSGSKEKVQKEITERQKTDPSLEPKLLFPGFFLMGTHTSGAKFCLSQQITKEIANKFEDEDEV